MTQLSSLHDLFLNELKDLYDAERQLVKSLPKMIKAADSGVLSAALEDHLTVTEGHVNRIEKIFEILELPSRGKKCEGMAGLLKEGSQLLKEKGDPAVLDAGLIGAAQRVEHYEIAAYGTLASFARQLNMDEIADLLDETLAEEKAADEKLTEIASEINLVAVGENAAGTSAVED
jgi:ferritin-like metal-binding protein YciE